MASFASWNVNAQRLPLVPTSSYAPTPHEHFRIGMPKAGNWREIINTDAGQYQGSHLVNEGDLATESVASHGREQSIVLRVPPLATVILEPV